MFSFPLPKFVKIGALHSELVAVGKDGSLYQWRWRSKFPFFARLGERKIIFHPKTLDLDLVSERVVGLSVASARATVWTESGKLACWLDESIETQATKRFETRAQILTTESSSKDPDRRQQPTAKEPIVEVSTTGLFSLVRLASGLVYWWGIMPHHEQRSKCVEKYISKSLKARQEVTGSVEFGVGSLVCLKSAPLLHAGSIALAFRDPNQPCLVQLREHVFHFRDTISRMYKFRELKNPLNSSSTTELLNMANSQHTSSRAIDSNTSEMNTNEPFKGSLKRKAPEDDDPKAALTSDEIVEHSLHLNDVVFLEDAKASQILGRVLKVFRNSFSSFLLFMLVFKSNLKI